MPVRGTKQRALVASAVLAALGVGVVWLVRQWREDPELAAAKQAVDERNFPTAAQHLDAYLAANPDDVNARLLAAQTARRRGNFNEASTHLRNLEQKHFSPETLKHEHRLLALTGGDLSSADESIGFCRQHPADPQTAALLEAMIVGTLNIVFPPASIYPFTNEDRRSPLIARGEQLVGLWLETQQRPADQSAGLGWRARLRAIAGDYPGALADLRRVLQYEPEGFEANFLYALWISQEDPTEARARMEFLAKKFPDDPKILMMLASGYRTLGQLDEAARILDRLLAAPSTAILVERALVYLDQQKPEQAEPLLRRAFEQAPDRREVPLALARCMTLLGKADEARKYQDRFLQLDAQRKKKAAPTP